MMPKVSMQFKLTFQTNISKIIQDATNSRTSLHNQSTFSGGFKKNQGTAGLNNLKMRKQIASKNIFIAQKIHNEKATITVVNLEENF